MRSKIRSALSRFKRRVSGVASPDPYDWGGPDQAAASPAISELTLSVRPVADLALLQGVVPLDQRSEAVVELAAEAESIVATIPPISWLRHPADSGGDEVCFVLTLDEEAAKSATLCRLRAGDSTTSWTDLPKLLAPAGMPGVEAIDHCPACDGTAMVEVGRRQGLTMQKCASCDLMMTSPRPVEDHTLVRYSEAYFEGEYLDSQDDGPAMVQHWDNLLDAVEPYKSVSPTLHEIGVGGGSFLSHAMTRGWSVSGSDVNAAAVEYARGRELDVLHENVDHARSLGGPYGAVVSEMSLEHVRDPRHVVDLASESLAAGGALLIFTVSHEGMAFRYEGMASHLVGPAEHLFLFSADSLIALCERAGLQVERVWRGPHGDEIGILATR